jgi:hypothetical protein
MLSRQVDGGTAPLTVISRPLSMAATWTRANARSLPVTHASCPRQIDGARSRIPGFAANANRRGTFAPRS